MARREVPIGAPYIAPGSRLSPAVAAYQAGVTARHGGGLPKADMPLNPERPPIPNLLGGPIDGQPGTMADYARRERTQMGPPPEGGILDAPPAPAVTQASLGLGPLDTLPEAARHDPAYIQGPGSDLAANQPALAAKYGIYRSGVFIPPQKLGGRPGPSSLRPETLRDLNDLQRLQNAPAPGQRDATDSEVRQEVAQGLGGDAARVAGTPPPSGQTPNDEQLKDIIDRMDSFEFDQWRQQMMSRILHSEDERIAIEKRLEPLDIGQYIREGRVRQRIPIIPGKYELTLQSYDGQAELAIKRLAMAESRSVDVTDRYILEKRSFMALAVGIYKINDKLYPDVLDTNGDWSDDLFLKKFNLVMKLPVHILASIGVNLMWFEVRVRKLCSATALGNG